MSTQPLGDHPHTDPGDGRTECLVCGKWVHQDEYIRRPIARPHVAGHFLCLCCDILTAHPSSVCMSCQSRSREWSDLANDPAAIADLRRANKRMPRQLRRVVFA